MAKQNSRAKFADATGNYGVDAVINAANANDRFKLLEDDRVCPANLTNPIHPLFHQLKGENHLQLALQLASQFLLHDRTLEFFVPLLHGREIQDLPSMKRFLCDPLVYASQAREVQYLASVRQALQCLAKHLNISFVNSGQKRVWGLTRAVDMAPSLTTSCCQAFQKRKSPEILLSNKFLQFYQDPHGYAQACRCARFRHDFLFATTLVHEVVHAVGVMQRGNLVEPHYRIDYPETEWGYAWENFMFGSILNPQAKDRPGTWLLMRKVWADANVATDNGGKEYCDVPMSWVAQWFRTETWKVVAERGPTAVPPPTTHFKIRTDHKLGAWIVSSEDVDVRKDIAELNARWRQSDTEPDLIFWNQRTAAELQESNVPVPSRIREVPKSSLIQQMVLPSKPKKSTKQPPSTHKVASQMTAQLIPAYRISSACSIKRKLQVEVDCDCDQDSRQIKHSRS
ncbi:hypothetical protein SVAN01_05502 [Stagonosporopsis vannaccii]|nr:hypothetical protein SVAN01_05502 [Stagonosporopsis vannaccii]